MLVIPIYICVDWRVGVLQKKKGKVLEKNGKLKNN